MAATYLDEILDHHRARAIADARDWRDRIGEVHYSGPSFVEALTDLTSGDVKVIAEVKRRSPSKGWLREDLDPVALVGQYVAGGAAAISVLTDSAYFAGSAKDLRAVASVTTVPILRKDFTVSENDVLDAAAMGASAVLLIVAALSDEELATFIDLARECGIDAVVEVHDSIEAQRAIKCGADIVGVNQRDLRTFEIDVERAAAVIQSLPSGVVSVCESGLRSLDDVKAAASLGFNAVLVGETFVTAHDVIATVSAFSSISRADHG